MRDDFSEPVKRTIANRAGNHCSRPGCGALTSGPQVDPAKSLNVGVAAHISAASPGGPRYDPNLSAEARQHPDNGIWLCQTCAKLVDNDAIRFPADRLRAWRVEAEANALEMIGKTRTDPKQPDLRLEVRPALALDPLGAVFPLLAITAQNHGTSDVFLQSITLELKSGKQFFYSRDSVTGEYQGRRQLRPGESFTMNLDPHELVRHRVSPDDVVGAIARDAIDRVYRSTEENFPELIRHILQTRDERTNRG
jgi:hypothetical protein